MVKWLDGWMIKWMDGWLHSIQQSITPHSIASSEKLF